MSDPPKEAAVQRLLNILDGIALPDYYGAAGRTDEVLASMVDALAVGPDGDWDAFVRGMTERHREVLGRYSLRAPMLALRARDVRHLRTGLLAHAILTPHMRDWRDEMVFFALHHYVAREIGADPVEVFDDAAARAAPDLADIMRRFARRTDVSLGAFGWRRVETPEGPTFEMLGLRGAPTGAVVGAPSWEEVNLDLLEEIVRWVEESRERERRLRGESSEDTS